MLPRVHNIEKRRLSIPLKNTLRQVVMQYVINTKGVNRDLSAFQALSRIIVYVSAYITLRTPCLVELTVRILTDIVLHSSITVRCQRSRYH